jgi:hypothetical protein
MGDTNRVEFDFFFIIKIPTFGLLRFSGKAPTELTVNANRFKLAKHKGRELASVNAETVQ